MSDQDKLARLIDDLSQTQPAMYAIAEQARCTIHAAVPGATERVMYGGFMLAAPQDFCGVFVYAQHVSVEFAAGAELDAPLGVLEGKGKFRRHIKLRTAEDIKAKRLRDYVLRKQPNNRGQTTEQPGTDHGFQIDRRFLGPE